MPADGELFGAINAALEEAGAFGADDWERYKLEHGTTVRELQTVLLNEPRFKNIDRRGGVNIVEADI